MSATNSVVVVQGAQPYEVIMTAGMYEFTADEPHEMGGGGLGPNPYEYLLLALGSCTAITLKLYAQRKGYTLTDLKITLTHEKLENRQDKITRHIQIDGDFDENAVARFLDIAAKCPVSRTLLATVALEQQIESPKSSMELRAQGKKS